ncbi:hypothetical protein ACNAW0_09120 [Micromonospora sp. SL1-18]|uniref:hypothetical protein n=1 Tax=Micromonospora sp. SL1-18 TaxID=3399128 RepID=UPI003A4E591B
MSGQDTPRSVAEGFAKDLIRLLNTTVCDDAYIGIVERPFDGTVSFGTGLWPGTAVQNIRMRTVGDCACWLRISGLLFLDPAGYLTVSKSAYVVLAGDPAVELFHYDYERDKADYPDAHMQVFAGGDAWDELLIASGKRADSLSKLHLPVGGKRYRPALEDILESLIAEGILEPKPGWERVLDDSRAEFRRRQLKAAIRRDPDTAMAALQALGYKIVEPDRSADVLEFRKPSKLRKQRGRGQRL